MRKKSDMVGRVFIVVSLCLFAAGCGSRISMSNYEKIEAGMTEAEVEAILGKGEEQSSSSVDIPGQSIKVPGGGKFSFEGMSSSARAGQTQLVMAKMLIEMRNDDRSWEEIEDDPYMQYIKDEFAQWKQDRIEAGDRYK